jgi:hypothetical protein
MSKNEVLVITKEEVLAWWEHRIRYGNKLSWCFGQYEDGQRFCPPDFDDECHLCKRITEFRKEAEEEQSGDKNSH